MKTKKLTVFFFLFLLITVPLSFAQHVSPDQDEEQLHRDIRIAEGILHDLFFEEPDEHVPSLRRRQIAGQRVRGRYIPGYGVHFSIQPQLDLFGAGSIRSIRVSGRDEKPQIRIDVDDSEEHSSPENHREKLEQRMVEYFTTYAPLLRGFNENEVVRVTYGERPDGGMFSFRFFNNHTSPEPVAFSFSMWASVKDIVDFRDNRLSENEFRNRIVYYDFTEQKPADDLKIFASVLETAIQNMDLDELELRGKPVAEYLPGLGVTYKIQITPKRPRFYFGENYDFDVSFDVDSLMENVTSKLNEMDIRIRIPEFHFSFDSSSVWSREQQDSLRSFTQMMKTYGDSIRNALPRFHHHRDEYSVDEEKRDEEMQAIVNQISVIVSRYGSTLTSLAGDEFLMISVSRSRGNPRDESRPAGIELRIRKSDLLDGGSPVIEEIERR